MKRTLKAMEFDAYGTLFDVHSVISTWNQLFPYGRADELRMLGGSTLQSLTDLVEMTKA